MHLNYAEWRGELLLICNGIFSKLIKVLKLRSTKAEKTISVLEIFFSVYGFSTSIMTDNGSPFQSKMFRAFCEDRGITLIHSPQDILRAKGLLKRLFRKLRQHYLASA